MDLLDGMLVDCYADLQNSRLSRNNSRQYFISDVNTIIARGEVTGTDSGFERQPKRLTPYSSVTLKDSDSRSVCSGARMRVRGHSARARGKSRDDRRQRYLKACSRVAARAGCLREGAKYYGKRLDVWNGAQDRIDL